MNKLPRKIQNRKRGKHREKTVETPKEIVAILGKSCGNTIGNGEKWLGTNKDKIERIIAIITLKPKRTGFHNSESINLHQTVKISKFYI